MWHNTCAIAISIPLKLHTNWANLKFHTHKYCGESASSTKVDPISNNLLGRFSLSHLKTRVCCWLLSQFCMECVWSYHCGGDSSAGTLGILFPHSDLTQRGRECCHYYFIISPTLQRGNKCNRKRWQQQEGKQSVNAGGSWQRNV